MQSVFAAPWSCGPTASISRTDADTADVRRPNIDALLKRARQIAGRWPAWEKAESLVTNKMLATREEMDDEVVVAVIPAPGEHPHEVSLYPEDDEWECECGREPICEHVIASLLALTSGSIDGDEDALLERFPPRPKRIEVVVPDLEPESESEEEKAKPARRKRQAFPGKRRKARNVQVSARKAPKRREPSPLRYELSDSSYGLQVHRIICYEDEELELHRKLEGDGIDARKAPPVETTEVDMFVQDALGDGWETGIVVRDKASDLLTALGEVEDLKLDGSPVVAVDEELARMIAFVENFGADRVRIQVRPHPPVDKTFKNGFAKRGETLGRVTIESELIGEEFRRLTLGQTYEVKQLPHLVIDILPELKKQIPVEVVTDRLPDVVLSETRAVCWVELEGEDTLHVEAFVVYGDPIIAKIVKNRLVPEGKTVPIREPDEEVPMQSAIRQLGLVPGTKKTFTGMAARMFAQRLDDWDDGDVVGTDWEDLLDD